MVFKETEELLKNVNDEIAAFIKNTEDQIDRDVQQRKELEKNVAVESRLAAELEIHKELEAQLDKLRRRNIELDGACAKFENLHIADSDQNRLDNAKETYQLAKELTGIRFDYSAPPNVAKGYIKSESRKLLQPFEIDMSSGGDSEALWTLIQSTAAPGWPLNEKENKPYNK